MTHVVPLAIETGAVDDLAVHLGRQLDMVVGLRLHGEVGLLGLRGERYALRAEAEVVRFLTDDLQIRSNAAASCACTRTISKSRLFHVFSFLCRLCDRTCGRYCSRNV